MLSVYKMSFVNGRSDRQAEALEEPFITRG
jgi:hypothetical protein